MQVRVSEVAPACICGGGGGGDGRGGLIFLITTIRTERFTYLCLNYCDVFEFFSTVGICPMLQKT